ncbi:MAG: hypothetical protein VYD58_03275 [Candidatus Thermoplasmatota archaeon]|jgi:hypothetical protein|nr:hypothetical protein [Candidatus Thermoplasmatota archaeon]
MGLLDKAAASGSEDPKPKAKAVAKAKPVAKAKAKAKPVKAQRAAKVKKERAPRARPMELSDDYELATKMNRRISSLVNFFINFGVLFAALFIASADTSIVTTILFAISGGIIILNAIFIPMKFSRNLGQFVSRTKYVRGDGTNPLFLHGILVNTAGLLSLVGLIMVATQFQNLSEADNTGAIISFSLGTIFIILWFVDRYLRNGSAMGQGLYDLAFRAYLVKYIPSDDEKASGIWARLENMGNFGDQLVKRQEERKAKKESKKAETEDGEADDESESQDD